MKKQLNEMNSETEPQEEKEEEEEVRNKTAPSLSSLYGCMENFREPRTQWFQAKQVEEDTDRVGDRESKRETDSNRE